MHRFFVRCVRLQGEKRRNPLWILSFFHTADTTSHRKAEHFDFSESPYQLVEGVVALSAPKECAVYQVMQ